METRCLSDMKFIIAWNLTDIRETWYQTISNQTKNITCEKFFLKNHVENETGRLVLDLFLLLKKALYEMEANS